ncbi:hypothetical protein ACFV7Q_37735 [Streptomyces sp. NPDC059851]|uniref:hypothetical protein n=1 Tax=Streptomyces sp. NPDC059851 TaxID=3346971 RepID=UPI00365592C7
MRPEHSSGPRSQGCGPRCTRYAIWPEWGADAPVATVVTKAYASLDVPAFDLNR